MKHAIFFLTLLGLLLGSSCATRVFNVGSYGAKGDGVSDSTRAFSSAWKDACMALGQTMVYVPVGEYYMQPVTFQGPCKSSTIVVKIDGTLVGPTDYMVIARPGSWIQFEYVKNLVIQGGELRGRAQCGFKHCPWGGRGLSIAKSNNVWINHVTSVNSQGFHVNIAFSQDVHVVGATIMAPGHSVNTDGIHVGDSTGVTITGSNIRTGDDCISLGPGSENVWIQDIYCGPGHGISIGSLASAAGEQPVRNVTARDVHFVGTQNGYRIKTWAKPFLTTVSDIHFLNAVMTNVDNPIIIDQFYCPGGGCSRTQSSYAKISNVEFSNINGTSSSEIAIRFDCSSRFWCSGLTLQNVKLYGKGPVQSRVQSANVRTIGEVFPEVKGT